jgi:hypothetical protein
MEWLPPSRSRRQPCCSRWWTSARRFTR